MVSQSRAKPTEGEVLSIRAYARQRDPPVSHVSVVKAIQSGRLVRSVKRRQNGRVCGIVVAIADREWVANTDPGPQRDVDARAGPTRGAPAAPRAAPVHAPDSTPPLFPGIELPPEHPAALPTNGHDAPVAANEGGRLPDLRARLMESQASIAALDLAERAGQLTDAAGVEQAVSTAWGIVSAGFLALAEALPEEIATLKGAAQIRAHLRRAVRGELERLANSVREG